MVNKFNDLMDDTSVDPGKCHCCGEDLNTAHVVIIFSVWL